ncbi:hypothetical protein NST44_30670 [Paenibacillus sp. FSL W8-0919]|uniref:hypothetical protein n=1 Tax=Paenibacillus sp. FSL W8-0919 TaxID=2954707 RepID=UPI0030F91554
MKKLRLAILTALCLLAGCNQASDVPAMNSTLYESDIHGLNTDTNEAQQYTLSFEIADIEKPLMEITAKQLTNSILTQKIGDYTVYFYHKNRDHGEVNAAIQLGTNRFEIGQVGYSAQNTELFTVKQVDALGKNYIKVSGACGANCPISNYIDVDTGSPRVMRIEAHTVEADVDKDGIKEIVSTVGTIAQTSIYKLEPSHIVVANLNETLGVQEVTYDNEANTFVAGTTNWIVEGGRLQEIVR